MKLIVIGAVQVDAREVAVEFVLIIVPIVVQGGAMAAAKAIVWVLVKDHVIEIIVIDFNEHNQRA